jgi:hypothetical protein
MQQLLVHVLFLLLLLSANLRLTVVLLTVLLGAVVAIMTPNFYVAAAVFIVGG